MVKWINGLVSLWLLIIVIDGISLGQVSAQIANTTNSTGNFSNSSMLSSYASFKRVASCGETNFYVGAGLLIRDIGKLCQCDELYLANNGITTLSADVFQGCSISYLNLAYNKLSALPVGIFQGIKRMGYISFSYNNLVSVPSGICKSLTELMDLDISNNNIKSLDENSFRDCWWLWNMDLSNNFISTIHTKAFQGLKHLLSLSLHNNKLTSLPSNFFQGLYLLRFISLGGNLLQCVPDSIRGTYVYASKIQSRYKRIDSEELDLPICQDDDEKITPTAEKIKPKFIQVNAQRFAYQKCIETRSWEMIANYYKNFRDFFATGHLGDLADDVFEHWACFRGHPCLSELGALSPTDAMCYVYNEIDGSWFPWGIKSEIGNQCVLGV